MRDDDDDNDDVDEIKIIFFSLTMLCWTGITNEIYRLVLFEIILRIVG